MPGIAARFRPPAELPPKLSAPAPPISLERSSPVFDPRNSCNFIYIYNYIQLCSYLFAQLRRQNMT